jgi:hypothetical protein
MFTTGCNVEGIDFRSDYEKISDGEQSEYSGILHVRVPIAFIFNDNSFSPASIGQKHKDAIKHAIRIHEGSALT